MRDNSEEKSGYRCIHTAPERKTVIHARRSPHPNDRQNVSDERLYRGRLPISSGARRRGDYPNSCDPTREPKTRASSLRQFLHARAHTLRRSMGRGIAAAHGPPTSHRESCGSPPLNLLHPTRSAFTNPSGVQRIPIDASECLSIQDSARCCHSNVSLPRWHREGHQCNHIPSGARPW